MPQYVIEREHPGASKMTQTELREHALRSLAVLGEMGSRIQWIQSFVTDDKIYCIYLAPDEETIREHGRRAGARVDRVAAVRQLIDPGQYREG